MANPTVNLIKSGGNKASDSLSAAIDLDDLAAPLNNADEFDDNSMICVIDEGTASEEYVQVSGKTGSSLTIVTRGVLGTTATGHDSGATVSAVLTDWQWDKVIDAFDAEHDDDGKHTVDTIAEKTSGSGVTVDGLLIKDGGIMGWDGWQTYNGTFTRTGNHTFTVTGDQTAIFTKGTKVSYNDGSVDYGVVASSAEADDVTTVTLITNTSYVMADATITAPRYSYMDCPQGFPQYFSYSPTVTAATGTITTVAGTGQFTVSGKKIFVDIQVSIITNGTGGTEIRVTIPRNASPAQYSGGAGQKYSDGTAIIVFVQGGYLSLKDVSNGYPGGDGTAIAASASYFF